MHQSRRNAQDCGPQQVEEEKLSPRLHPEKTPLNEGDIFKNVLVAIIGGAPQTEVPQVYRVEGIRRTGLLWIGQDCSEN